MKEAILKLVRDRQHVTFAELTNFIDGFEGDIMLTASGDVNLIAWPWLSQDAFDSVQELLNSGQIHIHPASVMTYGVDGPYPSIPVATRPPPRGYKTPHWAPMCFCDYPYDPKTTEK